MVKMTGVKGSKGLRTHFSNIARAALRKTEVYADAHEISEKSFSRQLLTLFFYEQR